MAKSNLRSGCIGNLFRCRSTNSGEPRDRPLSSTKPRSPDKLDCDTLKLSWGCRLVLNLVANTKQIDKLKMNDAEQ